MHTRRGAFTLIETLATIVIIAMLLAILLPALGGAMGAARSFRCQLALRAVAFDFSMFADDQLGPGRGDDDRDTPGRFRLETFQESQYGVDEFWRWGAGFVRTLPDGHDAMPLRCAAVDGDLELWNGRPCTDGAIEPWQGISYTFNSRLHRADAPGGGAQLVRLNQLILDRGAVPLAWDVDGAEGVARGVSPVFNAPPGEGAGIYADGQHWFPGLRHGGAGNFAMIDGHVASSRAPLDERWDWGE